MFRGKKESFACTKENHRSSVARDFLSKFDIFGRPLPAFNIKGRTSVHTMLGGLCTLVVFFVMILYTSLKVLHLQGKENPNISTFVRENALTSEYQFEPLKNDFRIAFSVEGFRDKQLKNDPRYVKWIVRLYGKRDDVEYERILSHHLCTDADYDEFYPA